MPASHVIKDKGAAINMMGIYSECSKFVSLAHTADGYKLYPRVKKTEKHAFAECVSGKGGNVAKEWLDGE